MVGRVTSSLLAALPYAHTPVPTGQRNLFMFSMVNANNAIMDAVAR